MSERSRQARGGRLRHTATAGLLAAAIAGVPAASQPGARASESRSLRLAVSPAAPILHVRLPSANLRIVGSDAREVVVQLEGPATARAINEVSLARGADGHIRLTPAPAESAPRGTLGLRMMVPRTMTLEDVLVDSGRIALEGLTGAVAARVVRGAIDARDLGGRTRLEVETGDITARGVRLAGGASLKCRTFNGNVRVELAQAPVNARILALTLNGAVASPLPLNTRAAFGPRFAEATFGAGEHVLSIDAVRGDITIDVRRAAVR